MARTPSPVVLAAITACVVAAGAGAGMLLQPTKDRDPPAARGSGVSIAVVAPREPVPEPGAVMEVGDFADGYSHRDYARRGEGYPAPRDVAADDLPARIEPRRVEPPREIVAAPVPAPVIAEPREPPRRGSFGFDQPGPDYAAARRERRARMDDRRRLEDLRASESFADRDDMPAPRDDRAGDGDPDRDRRGRERQWYRSDGTPAPDPEMFD